MEILKIEDLSFTYPLCRDPALKNLSFSIESGDFTVICGDTGSGKSTLLRMLKPSLTPKGDTSGKILFKGKSIDSFTLGEDAGSIGFVIQNPELQIVCDKVSHELAFGLENLAYKQQEIARKVAEMACYFGIETWFDRSTSELSGGQKQLLNLASIMVMSPEVIILDEPTSQLDPIAASDFIATLKKINRDFGTTVIIVEHRLEELIPICNRLIVLRNGELILNGSPRDIVKNLSAELLPSMPLPVRLYRETRSVGECPLTVKDGRLWLEKSFKSSVKSLANEEYKHSDNEAMRFKDVCFTYDKSRADVLRDLSFSVYEGEIFCILGGNGSGKTTALGVAAGVLKAYSGSVSVLGKKLREYKNQSLYNECIAFLPQDVQTVFLCNTVREELKGVDVSSFPFSFEHLRDKHPYDLSGGEQQLLALAKVLSCKPRILLADELTKGLDQGKKLEIIKVLRELRSQGLSIVMVTHDVEFAAACADRCAFFFRGSIVSSGTPREFFSANNFYTTSACRMSRGYYDNAVTLFDLITLCKLNGKREEV